MAKHNDTGKIGEMLAAGYLTDHGYSILEKNWRFRHFEVDLIVSRNNILHFIEVKCRYGKHYGHPEESVHKKKIAHLIDASAEYLYRYPEWKRIQFDVLSITLNKTAGADYFFIEDVYE